MQLTVGRAPGRLAMRPEQDKHTRLNLLRAIPGGAAPSITLSADTRPAGVGPKRQHQPGPLLSDAACRELLMRVADGAYLNMAASRMEDGQDSEGGLVTQLLNALYTQLEGVSRQRRQNA